MRTLKSFFKNKFITSHYSPGHEILTYLVSFYEKFKLYDHTKLNAEVITKTWLADRRKWQIVIRYRGTRISIAISLYIYFVKNSIKRLNNSIAFREALF